MSISIPEFWKLVIDSQLLNLQQCRQYGEAFGNVKGAATQSNARTLAEWLTADNVLSRYQAQVLLDGRAGPFDYGEYKVYDRIKRGLVRSVFPAVHVTSQHPVTLFFLPETPRIDEAIWAEVLEGSQSAIAIQHPNVGRCHELLDAGGYKFVVMEHMSGETAAKRIASRGALAAEEACYVIHQIALGLSQLHAAGRAHGELQPSSIWLGDDGAVKLMQAPLSRLPFTRPGELDRSVSPAALHAADYAAPELIQSGRARDELTDVYSLGCMFYELLSGRVPFVGGSLQDKLTCHATKAIEPLDALGFATQPLAQVVTYMMAKDPSVRYQNATAVVETIAAFVDPARWQKPAMLPPATLAAFDSALAHRESTQLAMRPTAPPEEDFRIDVKATSTKPSDTPITEFPTVGDAPSSNAAIATSAVVATGAVAATSAAATLPSTKGPSTKGPSTEGPSEATKATTTSSAADRFHNKKTSRTGLWLALAAVAVTVVAVALLGLRGCDDDASATKENGDKSKSSAGESTTPPDDPTDNGAVKSNDPNNPETAAASLPYELVDDDGSGLWAPPTQGIAADLAYLAPGAKIVFIVRPADILAHGDNEMLIDALGPFGSWMRQSLELLAGVEMSQVERLVIGVRDEGVRPTLSLVVHPRGPSDENPSWQVPTSAAQHDGKTYYTRGGNAYYKIDERAFAVTPTADIADVIDAGDAAPAFTRQMEQLLVASDADRHLTVLFQTADLRNRSHRLFRGSSRPLANAIDFLLGSDRDVTAGLLSFHFGKQFFGELRLLGPVDKQPETLAREVFDRMQSARQTLNKAYASGANLSIHGRNVLSNYPRMIDALVRHTRHGADGPQAILRFSLPPHAAHNLVMGTELALHESSATGTSVTKTPSAAKTLREKLKQTISMSFEKEELQVALATFKELSGVDVQIMGKDLELDGITRNKAVTNFRAADRPAGEVLRMLLIQGNPSKVERTDDPEMKLVYVIKRDAATGRDAVFLTTRSAAARRGDKLPVEFAIKR